MYRALILFVKDSLEEEWREELFVEESRSGEMAMYFMEEAKSARAKYKYVREELERKDSVKTFVWEWKDGVLSHRPTKGDNPCPASRFNTHPNKKIQTK